MIRLTAFISMLIFSCISWADPDCSDEGQRNNAFRDYCEKVEAKQVVENYNALVLEYFNESNTSICPAEKYVSALKEYQDAFIAAHIAKCELTTFCRGSAADCGMGHSRLVRSCKERAHVTLLAHLESQPFSSAWHCHMPKLNNDL